MLQIEAIYTPVMNVVEVLGTMAFFMSGLRHATQKHFDWFGGFVCGAAVAVGGGTLRDVMLGATPFWMTSSLYLICCLATMVVAILFRSYVERLNNTWMVFDTLGLALFTIAGLQKALAYGQPFWVAIIMGCVTGSAGGVIRDVLLNNVPVIFKREIYAMASILGGMVYWALVRWVCGDVIASVVTFIIVCAIRFVAVWRHISLPSLRDE